MGTALFRTDASGKLGGGHVRRCLVLADALRTAGWHCTFAVAFGSEAVVPYLARSGHRMVEIASRESDAFGELVGSGFDLAVIDHYELGAEFEHRCRSWADRILVIDDNADRPHDCDFLLDPTPARTGQEYRQLLCGRPDLMLGPHYALMERRFFARRLMIRDPNERVERAFVSFGAADQQDASGKSVKALRAAAGPISIDIAVGAASPNIGSLKALLDDGRGPVRLAIDHEDMSSLMAAADIAIGAAGGTGWERCCLGLPSLVVTVADNQRENAVALQDMGAVRWLGDAQTVTIKEMATAVGSMIEDITGREAMRLAALSVTDGLGVNRVTSVIQGALVAKDGRPVSLRPATADDCRVMFAWQTAPEARRYARNPRPPTYGEHQKWFSRKLADPRSVFNVVLHDGDAVGLLRYDWCECERQFEVSILVAREWQAHGIASAALAAGRRLLPEATIVAVIDPANERSVALFKKAGFRHTAKGRYTSSPDDALPNELPITTGEATR